MKLFHGTNISIDRIDLSKCRPHKDFGLGFYTTEIEEQAVKMAKRVSRIYGGKPVVNVYEFDETVLQSKVQFFCGLSYVNNGFCPASQNYGLVITALF